VSQNEHPNKTINRTITHSINEIFFKKKQKGKSIYVKITFLILKKKNMMQMDDSRPYKNNTKKEKVREKIKLLNLKF
jgi:hypothetical protein